MTDQGSERTDSETETTDDPARNLSMPHTSSDWKVLGQHAAESGAGVLGHNTSTSGAAPGVEGVTDSTDDVASGVKGETTGGPYAPSGVHGETPAAGYDGGFTGVVPVYAQGVLGRATATSGVAYNAGVRGISDATSGSGYGVIGRTSSNNSNAAGVYANSTGDGSAAVFASGHVDIVDVGVSAYLSDNQTIESGNTEVVAFDQTEADHFSALSSGTYTVATSGDYHVDFTIQWFGKDSDFDGSTITYKLVTDNGTTEGVSAQVGQDTANPQSFSKTLFGLQSDDTIEVKISNTQASDLDVLGGNATDSFLTINKVG